ncbi:MAG: SDR family oxidoreductase [Thermomicrobiales bacterium]|nr:SDR family oxidoreductase [Thermomicrobiales bacterium]
MNAAELTTFVPQMIPAPGSRMVVAGGCGGIGRALVATACRLGIDVIVMDLPQSLASSPVPAAARAIAVDATSDTSVAAAFAEAAAQWDRVDCLVNLVGFTKEQVTVENMAPAEWDEIVDGTLRSAYLIVRHAFPLLRRSAAAAIVNTSSTFGVAVPVAGYAPYAVAKAGIINLTRALATEGAPAIRANAIAPGLVDTAFLRGGTGRTEKASRINRDAVIGGTPLKRIGQPADMVGPILFLLSPAAGYITAQTVHVNGGTWS